MTPTWVFPAYPLMLTAPFASNLIAAASSTGRIDVLYAPAIAFSAVSTQGTGCLISLMISAAFIYRLMTQKLPRDFQRPGIVSFKFCEPKKNFSLNTNCLKVHFYWALCLHSGINWLVKDVFPVQKAQALLTSFEAQLGNEANVILPPNFLGTEHSVEIVKIIALLVALWLWGLSMWFFLVSVGSLWKYLRARKGMPFQMTWWSFVFPNTALVSFSNSFVVRRQLILCTLSDSNFDAIVLGYCY